MSLAPGTKLGPYEIVEPIGKGGMGEVYKGYDPRLRREVAINMNVGHLMLLLQYGNMSKELCKYNTKLFAEKVPGVDYTDNVDELIQIGRRVLRQTVDMHVARSDLAPRGADADL